MADPLADLWPPELADNSLVAPVTIMRQQASALSKRTRNLVQGKVRSWTRDETFHSLLADDPVPDGDLIHSFQLVVPALDQYSYGLFEVRHGPRLYPLAASVEGKTAKIDSQDEFVEWLKQVLGSAETKRVVSALLAQVRS